MGDYVCPFCGGLIRAEDVLFVDESYEATYEDAVRHNYLSSCCKEWPFDDGNRFRGLYFRATPDRVTVRDANNFPIELRVLPSEGLTPSELMGMPRMDEEGKKPLNTGFTRKISTRVCPQCHCRLPGNFGVIPTIYVTMLGGRAAGKTAYLISLVHRLNSQLTALGLGTATLLNESRTYYNFHNEYYLQHKGVTMPTPTDELLFPFIFEYSYLNGAEPRSCFVAIYDIAGEGTTSTDYLLNHYGIQVARTVLLMLDPNQLNNGLYSSMINLKYGESVENRMDAAEIHDNCHVDIGNFLSRSVLANRAHGVLCNVRHLIAVTTKIDQPMTCRKDLFGGKCVLRNDIGTAHRGRINLEVIGNLREDLKKFYFSEGRLDIETVLNSVFRVGDAPMSLDLLAVSTWTRDTSTEELRFENKYEETGAKHRVVEPFLMILARAGIIPVGEDFRAPTEKARQMMQEIDRKTKEIAAAQEEIRSGRLTGMALRRKQKQVDGLGSDIEKLRAKVNKEIEWAQKQKK